jgi:hypothetical protein
MGWKCSCLFVGNIENGYFATKPKHSSEQAQNILRALGHNTDKIGKKHHADIYPAANNIVVGAFEKGAFLANTKIMDFLETGQDDYFRKAMSCYPGGNLLALALHSVVDFSAFAYYQNGQLRRMFACASDPGIIRQDGARLLEEEKQYEGSFERDGALVFPRTYDGRTHEFAIAGITEEIVFDLSARPLGQRYDQVEEDIFETESYIVKPRPFWRFW